MRIVTGTYRGRQIPSGRRLRQIRLTSTRLKEAVFSMLGPNLKGRTFLDLCAGSGQMGLEALSRGASVELNEPDHLRRRQIRSLLYQWRAGVAGLHSVKAQHLIPQLAAAGRRFDIVYADPPYHARYCGAPLLLGLIEAPRGISTPQRRGPAIRAAPNRPRRARAKRPPLTHRAAGLRQHHPQHLSPHLIL